ncbi:hypothetical protein FHS43_003426 [Streptosporangium becharense]|uniref:Uncharacterized protein n=1 Tax=Streptosporangium becharense TaxID=1816182 RepID=A0A7W9IEN1_9ACTN|nr:hypothetical protein [Streptosporangium becharense]MBB2912146.1 hypothetical protein [Streptosporangium becharense]MBB5818693.1 hypothetical protein [Streptosporangium becharense]
MKTDRGREDDAREGDGRNDPPAGRVRRVKDAPRNQEWLLTLLPAFPLVLLVMRLWYASRQDTQTLLLLVQTISPLGLLSAVLLTTVWVLPALVLGGRLLGTLHWLSTGRSSWLVRAAERLPGWVVVLSVVVGLCTWQLRFLPTLAMMSLAVAGLTVRDRYPGHEGLRAVVCYALPVAVAVLSYVLLWPAVVAAFTARDVATAILLTLPPGLGVLLTGPVPGASAGVLTHGIAIGMSVITPFLVGVVVMKAPILPLIALQIEEREAQEVVVGYLVASDDQMSTVLGREGAVRFISNDRIRSRVLCPDPGEVPRTWVNLHGWYVEQSVLSWLAPTAQPEPVDQRCQGRAVDDPVSG